MKYGVKVGVNMTTISNDMSFDPGFGMGVGYHFGGLLNMRWGQRTENSLPGTGVWGFQPELMFSSQTATSDADNVTLNYISVPLLLKIYPTTAFSLEVGPEFCLQDRLHDGGRRSSKKKIWGKELWYE